VLRYSPLIESRAGKEVFTPKQGPRPGGVECWGQIWRGAPASRWEWDTAIVGRSRTGWGVVQLEAMAESFIFRADVDLLWGRGAGLAFRMDEGRAGYVVAYDAADRCLYLYGPDFSAQGVHSPRRQVARDIGHRLNLKVVARREHIEAYINDQFLLTAVCYGPAAGRLGLYVDRAEAAFSNLRARPLRIKEPR
jgi:hypothetical protein